MKYVCNILFTVVMLMLAGCVCGPARWAELLQAEVRCGMSPQEVEHLSGRKLTKIDLPSSRSTHLIGEEGEATEVRLVFRDDKLQSIQIAWMYRLKKMASAQRAELCNPVPDGGSQKTEKGEAKN